VQDAPPDGVSSLLHALASESASTNDPHTNRRERATWHAVVVHVQTNEEKNFTDFADAIAFITRYVPLGDFVFKSDSK